MTKRDEIVTLDYVECPCCKGKGYLVTWDADMIEGVGETCTHCMGERTIKLDKPMRYFGEIPL